MCLHGSPTGFGDPKDVEPRLSGQSQPPRISRQLIGTRAIPEGHEARQERVASDGMRALEKSESSARVSEEKSLGERAQKREWRGETEAATGPRLLR